MTIETGDKKRGFGFRFIALLIGSIAALLLTFFADPDTMALFKLPVGTSTFLLVKSLAYFALAALVIHIGFKTMFDYIDRSALIAKAVEQGQAGSVFIGLAIFVLAFSNVFNTLIALPFT